MKGGLCEVGLVGKTPGQQVPGVGELLVVPVQHGLPLLEAFPQPADSLIEQPGGGQALGLAVLCPALVLGLRVGRGGGLARGAGLT